VARSSWKAKLGGVLVLGAASVGCPAASPEPGAEPSPTSAGPSAAESASPAPSPKEAALLQIDRSFFGRVSLEGPGPGNDVAPSLTLVIRSAEEFAAFASAIPKKRVQKRQPAPPSNDPLLKDPQLDFATQSLIVIQRPSMYVNPEIERVEARGAGAHVLYRLPPLGDTVHAAAVMDMGTYAAVLVPKIEGEVSFELLPNPAEGEQLAEPR